MKQGRKISGGRYHQFRKKRLHERDSQERVVLLKDTKRKQLRVMGGNVKSILLGSNFANVLDVETKKVQQVEIKKVLETPQNVFLARQNRLAKGAIILTAIGKAKITNRPSQEGHVNSILIKE